MENGDKKKILLVEDEALLAMAQKMHLEQYGYSVSVVTTGENAVELMAENPDIQLILMDIGLGKGIDGTETASRILKNRDIPVLFCSSHTESEIVSKTEKISSYGYVVKSSSITVLDASIKMAFKLFEAKNRAEKIAQDLRTHQIELQMQNEELRNKQTELDTLRQGYRDLYDTAPVAYITIGEDGRILEANNSALELIGEAHGTLIGQSFSTFISPVDQDRYYLHRKALQETRNTQTCELTLRRQDDSVFPVHLKSGISHSGNGAAVCRVVAVERGQVAPHKSGKEMPV